MASRTPTRILIIGCGKTKLAHDALAKDLYIGPIFKARRKHAERSGHQWYIASAQYGLVSPDFEMSTYDKTLDGARRGERALWAVRVVESLLRKFADNDAQGLGHPSADFKDVCIELHMGEPYAEYLTQIIPSIGMLCHWATKGLSQGEQLQWYKRMAGLPVGVKS